MIQIIVRRSLMPRIKVIMNISLDTRRKREKTSDGKVIIKGQEISE